MQLSIAPAKIIGMHRDNGTMTMLNYDNTYKILCVQILYTAKTNVYTQIPVTIHFILCCIH
jgi:hypothetical protein